MILRDYHVHTSYCDGKDSPEEIVLAAIEKGMEEIGILTHSFVPFDRDCCIPEEKLPAFQAEIRRLKEKYRGQIRILLGVEQDLYSPASTAGFDYVIGSVHYLKCGDVYCSVDHTKAILQQVVEDFFSGDYYAFAEAYYQAVSIAAERTHANLIGHFDLLTKFNEGEALFSECDPRYVASYRRALKRLLPLGIPFEVNTGAISRGYRTAPYPSQSIVNEIRSGGGKLLLSSDSHDKSNLCFQFEKWQHLLDGVAADGI